ncbi:hypothetical protein L6R50_09085 [Myxococcota bacterium]|nr:hypothetical protein [Myxococcota bacterium]
MIVFVSLASAGCDSDAEACGSFGVAQPDLTDIQERVFDNSCAFSSCHSGAAPQAGLDLSTVEAAFASLVGAAAETTTSDWVRVAPGDPGRSYLMVKLKGQGIEANPEYPDTEPMPPPAGGICERNIQAISDWIATGAEGP